MAEHSIVQSAKQGDPKAIAYLITHTLQKYGITARANRKGLCLKLLLEAEQVPHQATMVKLVTQGMQRLNVETLQMVKLYGRQQGQPTAAWRHVIELLPQSLDANQTRILDPEMPGFLNDSGNPALNGAALQNSETPLFQMDDLDPDAMILLPIDSQLQLDDLDPDSLILFPIEPLTAGDLESDQVDYQVGSRSGKLASDPIGNSIGDPDSSLAGEALKLNQRVPLTQSQWVDAGQGEPQIELQVEPDPWADPVNEQSVQSPVYSSQKSRSSATELGVLSNASELSEPAAIRPAKLPQRLTLLLLCLLWFSLVTNTLGLVVSLLKAGSFSLYAGLDLSSTNQPFAGLLLAVVGLASFIFTPFSQLSLGLTVTIVLLSLVWLHRIHASLHNLMGRYPISPRGAVLRFLLPIYNIWGIGRTCLSLANRLAQSQLKQPSRLLQRLTVWLYLSLGATIGLQIGYLVMADSFATFFGSFWFDVARDTATWILSLVWLRIVRITWRALRQLYKIRMRPFLSATPFPRRERAVNLSAILLGAGASLISLGLLNSLLGLIATLVFLSNGLRPESIFPTFYDSESLLILVLCGSFLCIGLGGFLTAQLAHRSIWLHALGLGVLLTLIGLALRHLPLFPTLAELPFWFQTASAALIIPATLSGCGLQQWFRSL